MPLTVIAIADAPEQAAAVLTGLRQRNYGSADVSMVYLDHLQRSDANVAALTFAAPAGSGSLAQLSTPAVALPAGVIGEAYQWLQNLSAIPLRGVGTVVAGGPLLAAIGSGQHPPEDSGLQHALITIGVDADESRCYEERVLAGGILIAVQAADAAAVEELTQLGNALHTRDFVCAVRPPSTTDST